MSDWQPDRFLPGFEAKEYAFAGDYDGPVVATLVRLPPAQAGASRGPVLYVHGFVDYFFQRHMAERFAAEGYEFHALDLRKHGRSLRPRQHPYFCMDLAEYFEEIDAALEEIGAPVLLIGHSTGGLVCSLYAMRGGRREKVRALWLNSPFFEFNATPAQRKQIRFAAALGTLFPYLSTRNAVRPEYVRSLHRDYGGEWQFDLALKPADGFPASFGWLAAIQRAHAEVQAGPQLPLPVLAMHSDEADIILDWRHIARYSRTLGPEVTVLAFPGAMHDLVLSRAEIRDSVFSELFAWAERIGA
jgi:alpha-beta hydrolase superfamily lysophospholipase